MAVLKKCAKCSATKLVTEFSQRGDGPSHRASYCKTCMRAYREDNKEEAAASARRRYLRDHGERRAKARAIYYAMPEPDRAKERKRLRDHYKANKGKANAKKARRLAAKDQRFPAWADRKAIREVYETCPPGYQVDHIIPLRGEFVSGLHVANNLQHLPASENLRKGNRV